MGTFIAICLGILTFTHLFGLVFIIFVLLQFRRSAEAVEVLAYRAQDQVEKLSDATDRINEFTGSVRSGWIRILTVGLGAAVDFLSRVKQKK